LHFVGSNAYDLDVKKTGTIYFKLILLVGLLLIPAPAALADDALTGTDSYPVVVISEMQAGSATSASQEFIELYNQSPLPIDLSTGGWQVQIASSMATDWSKAKIVALSGIFYPGTYLLLASSYIYPGDSKSYLQDFTSAQFSSGLSANSGHIRVVNASSLSSAQPSEDSLEWSIKNTSGVLQSGPIGTGDVELSSSLAPGSSLKRNIDASGFFITTKTVAGAGDSDYLVSTCPSPTSDNLPSASGTTGVDRIATTIDIINPACTEPTEPDPSPILPPTTTPPAVLLPDDFMPALPSNMSIPPSDIGLEAPQLTELLPNPAPPAVDSHDEFVELYNGNTIPFDLSNFVISNGKSDSQRFSFPNGTVLEAQSFVAFYAWQTGLSLVNSGGQVSLYDPLGNLIGQSTPYDTAKDGQAWAFANSQWQWTDLPSPGNPNTIHMPPPKSITAEAITSKKSTSSTTAKSASKTISKASTKSSIKVATPPKKSTNSKTVGISLASQSEPGTAPVHAQIIAFIGSCALLYGIYEYRHDLANRYYQFRSYRTARRALRPGNKRWRGD